MTASFSHGARCASPTASDLQAAQKDPDARRRPKAAREAYSLYVERAAEGDNEADGPFSAACDLRGAMTASRRLHGDWHEAERTRSCRRGGGSGREKPVDLPDKQ